MHSVVACCLWLLPVTVGSFTIATVQVEPLHSDLLLGSVTTEHPRDLPRTVQTLPANPWTGPVHDNFISGLTTALKDGFAVVESAEALFDFSLKNTNNHEASKSQFAFTPSWFASLPSMPDTTTIPYTQWLPRDTHHEFARHLHQQLVLGEFRMPDQESYAGVCCIGGARQRGNTSGNEKQAPNLSFLHQDECKFSVLMAEYYAAASASTSTTSSPHPLDGIEDTLALPVRQALTQAYSTNKNNPSGLVCRQVNLWCPHQHKGDKHLVFLTRTVSQALVQANLVTTCQLPRFDSSTNHPTLNAVNHNFQLTDQALDYAIKHYPDQIYAVNQPILFVSHETHYDRLGTANESTEDFAAAASQSIFHCGATLENLGHGSTEMRLAIFSRSRI